MESSASDERGDGEALERSRMEAEELSWSLRAANRAATEVDRALAAHLSLRLLEYDAVDHIMTNERDPIGPVELASRLGISPGSATELVDRLERRGHVVRERGLADRRRVLVTASPEVVQRILGDLGPLFGQLDELAASFSRADQSAIERYLREASALLRRHAAGLAARESTAP